MLEKTIENHFQDNILLILRTPVITREKLGEGKAEREREREPFWGLNNINTIIMLFRMT